MLPITADAGARPRDAKSFVLRITPEAAAYDFMRLGSSDRENAKAWANLGPLPWYQPANRMHPLATALAVHPTDVCADGKTPQPIIAVRRFGRGEVVYLAFDETWRLRRRYGEEYYRQFWGQMIHRLGLSHALGSQKRFVVRTDRQAYQPDDEVVVTVEAFNANYEPLSENDLPDRALHAELVLPAGSGQVRTPPQQLKLPQSRPGVFEARVPVLTPGEHRLSVTDPVTNERSDLFFRVASVSVERRSAVRNVALEREIAQATGGRSYDLTTVNEFLRDFNPAQRVETSVKTLSAWNTWPAFLLVVLLLLLEWLVRKLVSLP
jgi:hypothetical protein